MQWSSMTGPAAEEATKLLDQAASSTAEAEQTGPPSWPPAQVADWLKDTLAGMMPQSVLAGAAAACISEEISGKELLGHLVEEMKVRELLKLPFGLAVEVAAKVAELKSSHEGELARANKEAGKARHVVADAVDEAAAALLPSEALGVLIKDCVDVCLEIMREKVQTMQVDGERVGLGTTQQDGTFTPAGGLQSAEAEAWHVAWRAWGRQISSLTRLAKNDRELRRRYIGRLVRLQEDGDLRSKKDFIAGIDDYLSGPDSIFAEILRSGLSSSLDAHPARHCRCCCRSYRAWLPWA